MIAVSKAWDKASKERLLPEMLVELTYQVSDPGIHEAARVTGVNADSGSKISDLLTNPSSKEVKYTALNHNAWGLDGSFAYYDAEYKQESFSGGYYSQFSSPEWADGYDPQIVISFSELRTTSLPGLIITWSCAWNEWASSFKVTAYRANEIVAEKIVTDNQSVVSEVELPMVGYTKIVITVLAWSLPHGMARCSGINLGLHTVLEKGDLLGYTHSQSTDLLSATLPKNSINFRLRNEKSQWNPENLTGQGRFLMDQQEIRVRYGMVLPEGTQWIDGGIFWLSEWDIPSNGLEASFTARDLITFMNETYTGMKEGTLYEIAEEALRQTYLPVLSTGAPSYVLDPVLKNYSTSFGGDFTVAEVLQLVAHAGCCVIYQDRLGTLRIRPWVAQYGGYIIDQSISYSHPEYTISRPLRSVSVGYGNNLRLDAIHSARGEVQTVDNEMVKTQEDASRVASNALNILQNRKVITGEFRADLRLDCLDSVIVTSKYASNIIGLTDVEYSTTGGAFRGRYTGRVVSVKLQTAQYYVGDLYSGEV